MNDFIIAEDTYGTRFTGGGVQVPSMWPGLPVKEVPIRHVTNGVHFRSWISLEMNQLYDRYLGPSWREQPVEKSIWQRVETIPAEELWRSVLRPINARL